MWFSIQAWSCSKAVQGVFYDFNMNGFYDTSHLLCNSFK